MPHVIEQDLEQAKLAWQATQSLAIEAILLKSAQVTKGQVADDTERLNTSAAFKAIELKLENDSVVFLTGFHYSIESSKQNEQQEASDPVASIRCVFESRYLKNPKVEIEDAAMKAFHESTVIYAAWPFFREFVQSSVTRMGFAAPPLEFLMVRIKPGAKDKPKDTTQTARLRRPRSTKGNPLSQN